MTRETEPTTQRVAAAVAVIVEQPRLGPQPAKPASRRSQPLRPRHVPQRTCVACRDKDAKRSLTRIVRTTSGDVEVDPTGKRNGRGAYLCSDPRCWEKALTTPILARALKTELTDDARDRLRTFAQTVSESASIVMASGSPERTH